VPTSAPTVSPTKATCNNDKRDESETDIDCGGGEISGCHGCSSGEECKLSRDCLSNQCTNGLCDTPAPTPVPTTSPTTQPTASPTVPPTQTPTSAPTPLSCNNGEQGGRETDVDCGGNHGDESQVSGCRACAAGLRCKAAKDCLSGMCGLVDGLCLSTIAPTIAPTDAPTTAPTAAPTAFVPTVQVRAAYALLGYGDDSKFGNDEILAFKRGVAQHADVSVTKVKINSVQTQAQKTQPNMRQLQASQLDSLSQAAVTVVDFTVIVDPGRSAQIQRAIHSATIISNVDTNFGALSDLISTPIPRDKISSPFLRSFKQELRDMGKEASIPKTLAITVSTPPRSTLITRSPTKSPTAAATPRPSSSPTRAPTTHPTATPTPASCRDSVKNNKETDIDCGGKMCGRCASGKMCLRSTDCSSRQCGSGGRCLTAQPSATPTASPTTTESPTAVPTNNPTLAPTAVPSSTPTTTACSDGKINGEETDIDCGGSQCGPCDLGSKCLVSADCIGGICSLGSFDGKSTEVKEEDTKDSVWNGAAFFSTSVPKQCVMPPPTLAPSFTPSASPTLLWSSAATPNATGAQDSNSPSQAPTAAVWAPTKTPTTKQPSQTPTELWAPGKPNNTTMASKTPTQSPTELWSSGKSNNTKSDKPSQAPTAAVWAPTKTPTTKQPSQAPTELWVSGKDVASRAPSQSPIKLWASASFDRPTPNPSRSPTVSVCRTTADSKDARRPCVFPFVYKGKKYNACTTEHSTGNWPWCSTSVDMWGEHIGGQSGKCDMVLNNKCFIEDSSAQLPTPTPTKSWSWSAKRQSPQQEMEGSSKRFLSWAPTSPPTVSPTKLQATKLRGAVDSRVNANNRPASISNRRLNALLQVLSDYDLKQTQSVIAQKVTPEEVLLIDLQKLAAMGIEGEAADLILWFVEEEQRKQRLLWQIWNSTSATDQQTADPFQANGSPWDAFNTEESSNGIQGLVKQLAAIPADKMLTLNDRELQSLGIQASERAVLLDALRAENKKAALLSILLDNNMTATYLLLKKTPAHVLVPSGSSTSSALDAAGLMRLGITDRLIQQYVLAFLQAPASGSDIEVLIELGAVYQLFHYPNKTAQTIATDPSSDAGRIFRISFVRTVVEKLKGAVAAQDVRIHGIQALPEPGCNELDVTKLCEAVLLVDFAVVTTSPSQAVSVKQGLQTMFSETNMGDNVGSDETKFVDWLRYFAGATIASDSDTGSVPIPVLEQQQLQEVIFPTIIAIKPLDFEVNRAIVLVPKKRVLIFKRRPTRTKTTDEVISISSGTTAYPITSHNPTSHGSIDVQGTATNNVDEFQSQTSTVATAGLGASGASMLVLMAVGGLALLIMGAYGAVHILRTQRNRARERGVRDVVQVMGMQEALDACVGSSAPHQRCTGRRKRQFQTAHTGCRTEPALQLHDAFASFSLKRAEVQLQLRTRVFTVGGVLAIAGIMISLPALFSDNGGHLDAISPWLSVVGYATVVGGVLVVSTLEANLNALGFTSEGRNMARVLIFVLMLLGAAQALSHGPLIGVELLPLLLFVCTRLGQWLTDAEICQQVAALCLKQLLKHAEDQEAKENGLANRSRAESVDVCFTPISTPPSTPTWDPISSTAPEAHSRFLLDAYLLLQDAPASSLLPCLYQVGDPDISPLTEENLDQFGVVDPLTQQFILDLLNRATEEQRNQMEGNSCVSRILFRLRLSDALLLWALLDLLMFGVQHAYNSWSSSNEDLSNTAAFICSSAYMVSAIVFLLLLCGRLPVLQGQAWGVFVWGNGSSKVLSCALYLYLVSSGACMALSGWLSNSVSVGATGCIMVLPAMCMWAGRRVLHGWMTNSIATDQRARDGLFVAAIKDVVDTDCSEHSYSHSIGSPWWVLRLDKPDRMAMTGIHKQWDKGVITAVHGRRVDNTKRKGGCWDVLSGESHSKSKSGCANSCWDIVPLGQSSGSNSTSVSGHGGGLGLLGFSCVRPVVAAPATVPRAQHTTAGPHGALHGDGVSAVATSNTSGGAGSISNAVANANTGPHGSNLSANNTHSGMTVKLQDGCEPLPLPAHLTHQHTQTQLHERRRMEAFVPRSWERKTPLQLMKNAERQLRLIEWKDMSLKLLSSSQCEGGTQEERQAEAARLTRPAQMGEIDVMLSHSWHDDPTAKWKALQDFAEDFHRREHRWPTFWLDKVCIDQQDIEGCLKSLSIYLMGCRSTLALVGETYMTRLWCVLELYTLHAFCDEPSVQLIDITTKGTTGAPHLGTDMQEMVSRFQVLDAHCFNPNEEALIMRVVDAGIGGRRAFEKTIRGLPISSKRVDGSSADAALRVSMSAIPCTPPPLPPTPLSP